MDEGNDRGGRRIHCYEISFAGRLCEKWTAWFQDMSIETRTDTDGQTVTVLTGEFADQAAFYGCLRQVHSLGLSLISFHRIQL